jgi:hypothetical protein
MRDQTVIRLIGWSGTDPVVVGYDGPYYAMGVAPGDVIISGFEGTVGVYLLAGGNVRTLVAPTDRVSFIDVTPALLAAPNSRPGDPPFSVPLSDPAIVVLSGLLVLVLAIVGGTLLRTNRRVG